MSEKRDTGGLAFPGNKPGALGISTLEGGMTLRDYFAAQALVGLLGSTANPRSTGPSSYSGTDLARISYDSADAMLAERAK